MHEPAPARTSRVSICPDPLFVIGSPRSGTTSLARALGEHSHFWTAADLDVMRHVRAFGGVGAVAPVSKGEAKRRDFEQDEFVRFLGDCMSALFTGRSGGRRWIVAKPYTVYFADLLAGMFPDASFVHILRDARGAVGSLLSTLKTTGLGREALWGRDRVPGTPRQFRDACVTWKSEVQAAMEFAEAHPGRCLTVQYEELVADAGEAFGAIYRFLGVPPEERPIDCIRSQGVNSSLPYRMPMVEGTSNPWQAWGRERKRTFMEEAGEALLRYGVVAEAEALQMEEDARGAAENTWSSPVGHELYVWYAREAVKREVPQGAVVLVVSKGDERLLELGDREAWHFPRDEDGEYPGYYPADSEEAIDQLERLRAQGAEYLVIPQSGLWWLEHYRGFREHLQTQYSYLHGDEHMTLYRLENPG